MKPISCNQEMGTQKSFHAQEPHRVLLGIRGTREAWRSWPWSVIHHSRGMLAFGPGCPSTRTSPARRTHSCAQGPVVLGGQCFIWQFSEEVVLVPPRPHKPQVRCLSGFREIRSS